MSLRAGALLVVACAVGAAGASACKEREEKAPALRELTPPPLPQISDPASVDGQEREQAYEVAPIRVHGDGIPQDAARLALKGEELRWDGAPFVLAAPDAQGRLGALAAAQRPVLLMPDEETYLVQASPLFALLDEAGVRTFLLHPEGQVAFRVTLSDEVDFRNWVDQSTAGQIRIIHRADGFELQTNLGKLKGHDPNGPSVPLRGGQWDLAKLRAGVAKLKDRFPGATESCIVPSFGMELADVARALTAYYDEDGDRQFPVLCLVYPRPRTAVDAGG